MDITVLNLLSGHLHKHRDTDRYGIHITYQCLDPDGNSIQERIQEAEFFGHYSQPHVAGLAPDATLRELSQRTAVWHTLIQYSRAESRCMVVPESRNKHCIELVTDNQPKACTARRMIHAIATNRGMRLGFNPADPLFGEPLALNFEFEHPNHIYNFNVDVSKMFEEVAFDVPAKLLKDYGRTHPAVLRALAVASVINGYHWLAIDCCKQLLRLRTAGLREIIERCLRIYDRLIEAARGLPDAEAVENLNESHDRLSDILRRS